MDFQSLKSIQLDDIYWLMKFGRPKRKGTIYDLRQACFTNIRAPVFFLSTGRCGTQWFSRLLSKDRSLKVLHAPQPSLACQGRLAYERLQQNATAKEKALIREIYLSGRETHLRYAYKCSKKLVETNNYITFFAPVLKELFPHAKFIHIHRHPGEFVRSGINRGYYTTARKDDMKRILPLFGEDREKWPDYSQIRKISWLWRATNEFVEDFKAHLDNERILTIDFNALTPERVYETARFIGAGITLASIRRDFYKKVNRQKTTIKSPFDQWDQMEKQEVLSMAGDLAHKYGYKIMQKS